MGDLGGFGSRSEIPTLPDERDGPSPRRADAAAFVPASEMYRIEGPMDRGGMGEVWLVFDRDLRRDVALKVLREDYARRVEHQGKFLVEARATSQLEHPGIPPVHDIGLTRSGRIYFTMKLVSGNTLAEVILSLLRKVPDARREWTLHRLVTVLERVAEALQYAHEKNVVHRDLKPSNVMLGSHGEVYLMDWGLAKVGFTRDHESSEDSVDTGGSGPAEETRPGTVKGTIPYMSPEQAMGLDVDNRSDVYAMGVILYEMLTLHRAFPGSDTSEILQKVQDGEYVPVRERNPRREVPDALAGLCTRAMAHDRRDRPQSAREFQRGLRSWLDGRSERLRRRKLAEELTSEGRAAASRFWRLRDELREAQVAAEDAAALYKSWQPVREKKPLLEARRRADDLAREMSLAFAETVKYLEAAIVARPGHADALRELCSHWQGRLAEAEDLGDRPGVAYALEMIRRYDDGTMGPVLQGDGTLSLEAGPVEAEVTLHRLEEQEGILAPSRCRELGRTPVRREPVEMGSYLAILSAPGRRSVRYPVHIGRNRDWTGAVRVRTEEEIGPEFVLVPGGPFLFGEGRTLCVRTLDDFAIAKDPVTFADYAEFLNAVPPEEAAAHMAGGEMMGPLFERGGDGRFRPKEGLIEGGPVAERLLHEYGPEFVHRLPVLAVSHDDAAAWCAWKTRVTGREWRLPTVEEWEKAARGVDGRVFPWGDLEDASLARCGGSRNEPPQPEPVGAFPTATSIYGMRDAAGNAWNWTSSWYDEHRAQRVLKGGSFEAATTLLRCAHRIRAAPQVRNPIMTFRAARSLR